MALAYAFFFIWEEARSVNAFTLLGFDSSCVGEEAIHHHVE